MIKLTVLYGHPVDSTAFESYYTNTHLPLVAKMRGFEKAEFTKFLDTPDSSKAAYHRMAEFWFANLEALQTTMGSTEGQASAGDLANFATGGVTLLTGIVG